MARKVPQGTVDELALLVARGMSVAAAARSLDVLDRTARNWAATTEFKATVDSIRASVISQSVGALGKAAVKAVKVLGKLLDSKSEDVQMRAAKEVLSNLLAVRDHAEVSARVDALERRAKPNGRLYGALDSIETSSASSAITHRTTLQTLPLTVADLSISWSRSQTGRPILILAR